MTKAGLGLSETCAIIVTYNPDIIEFNENVKSIIKQVKEICIVDNSTLDSLQKEVMNFQESYSLHVISNKTNLGIAEAQNQGLEWALDHGFEAFLLLDQDSKLLDHTTERLLAHHNRLTEKDIKVACIGPLAFNRDKSEENVYHNYGENNEMIIEVEQTLSSGSLISREALVTIGNMESDLFIDLVDYEWCWRAKEKGYSTFIAQDVKLAHRLGDDRINFLGIKIGIPSPVRHYYQFRNTLKLLFRSYVPKNFKMKYVILLPIKYLVYPLLAKQGYLRFKMINKGIMDAVKGIKGKGL
ncbi:glycosyltransferase family 2 protein [Neobacillus sp.]|uniref:glycosyltransferase family 2 protein n=1 Tax=Neobacillus sp. TaxID=2675273 RepID=UPI00289D4126|nr:glycosyltransferase family 2 protein [Neobacillus sp.]